MTEQDQVSEANRFSDICDPDPAAEITLRIETKYILRENGWLENPLFGEFVLEGNSCELKFDDNGDNKAKDDSVEAKILTEIATLDFIPREYRIDHCYIDDLKGTVFRAYDVISSVGKNRSILRKSYFVKEECSSYKECVSCDGGIYNTVFTGLKYLAECISDSDETAKEKLNKSMLKIRRAARFHLDVRVTNYAFDAHKQKLELVLKYQVSVYRHLAGEYASALPLPKFYEPKLPFGKNAVVVKGCCSEFNQVWKNLKELNSILRRDHRQVVALVGAQGGGVTTYAEALHQGQGKPNETLYPLSLAGATYPEVMALLFGEVSSGGHYSDGVIERAAEGTLLIEDFDEIDGEARRAIVRQLVRAIRTGEYSPLGSSLIRKIRNVNWIFTGEFDGNSAYWSDLPPDFLRLLTGKIKINHPLVCGAYSSENKDIETSVCDTSSYLKELFYYFFMGDVLGHCEGESLESLLKENSSLKLKAAYQLLTWGDNIEEHDREKDLFIPGKHVQEITDLFISKLGNGGEGGYTTCIPDSLRMVKQSARAVVAVLWPEAFSSPMAFSKIKDDKKGELLKECEYEIEAAVDTSRPPNDTVKDTSLSPQ